MDNYNRIKVGMWHPDLLFNVAHDIQAGMKMGLFLITFSCSLCAESLPSFFVDGAAVTLDDEAFASVRQEMQLGKPAEQTAPRAESPAAAWRTAMIAPTPEERAVRLMLLLTELNPDLPPSEYAALYIEALQLHTRALAGDAAASQTLAAALRGAKLCGGLVLPQDVASADKLCNALK